jgi:hypothetical protein
MTNGAGDAIHSNSWNPIKLHTHRKQHLCLKGHLHVWSKSHTRTASYRIADPTANPLVKSSLALSTANSITVKVTDIPSLPCFPQACRAFTRISRGHRPPISNRQCTAQTWGQKNTEFPASTWWPQRDICRRAGVRIVLGAELLCVTSVSACNVNAN